MDTTIRNLDETVYREAKARAALEGRTIGEVLNDAIRVYLKGMPRLAKTRSLAELKPEPFGPRSRPEASPKGRRSKDEDRY